MPSHSLLLRCRDYQWRPAEVADLKQQVRDLEDENQALNGKLDNIAEVLEPEEEVEDDAGDDDDLD